LDYLRGRPVQYGARETMVMAILAIVVALGVLLFVFERFKLHGLHRLLGARVYLVTTVSLMVLTAAGLALVAVVLAHSATSTVTSSRNYAIGIYLSSSTEPFDFSGQELPNPVLTRNDVTDVPAMFVADPFLIHENDEYYMFLEVWNLSTNQGDIAVAVSQDGRQWTYRQIVLDEPYTLSYPCVFKWNGGYYMIPETRGTESIRLYRADGFPSRWSFVKTLVEGAMYRDSTIFQHVDKWWLFSVTGPSDTLHLFYADSPLGPWAEHPQSPVVAGDPDHARPGGNVLVWDDRLVRFAQDCFPYYGNQVWAFEITQLTLEAYQERKVGPRPILKGCDNWNTLGMHQLSALRLRDGRWVAAVDGR